MLHWLRPLCGQVMPFMAMWRWRLQGAHRGNQNALLKWSLIALKFIKSKTACDLARKPSRNLLNPRDCWHSTSKGNWGVGQNPSKVNGSSREQFPPSSSQGRAHRQSSGQVVERFSLFCLAFSVLFLRAVSTRVAAVAWDLQANCQRFSSQIRIGKSQKPAGSA